MKEQIPMLLMKACGYVPMEVFDALVKSNPPPPEDRAQGNRNRDH